MFIQPVERNPQGARGCHLNPDGEDDGALGRAAALEAGPYVPGSPATCRPVAGPFLGGRPFGGLGRLGCSSPAGAARKGRLQSSSPGAGTDFPRPRAFRRRDPSDRALDRLRLNHLDRNFRDASEHLPDHYYGDARKQQRRHPRCDRGPGSELTGWREQADRASLLTPPLRAFSSFR